MVDVSLNPDLIHSTILERLEELGVFPASTCRGGFCGDCRLPLRQGEVEYIEAPLGFCGENEILPCIAMAKTELIIDVVGDKGDTDDD